MNVKFVKGNLGENIIWKVEQELVKCSTSLLHYRDNYVENCKIAFRMRSILSDDNPHIMLRRICDAFL